VTLLDSPDTAEEIQPLDLTGLLHAGRWPVDVDMLGWRLRNDHLFALQMAVCREYRIPHSAFLEWDELDQAKAIAFQIHESRRCGTCGILPEDWPDDAPNEDPPYEPDVKVCHGCEEMARYTRWLRDQAKEDDAKMDGVTPYLKRRG
jgi:hypothetical protein